jgi:immunity protein Imm1 of predicted polymorphic toxin system
MEAICLDCGALRPQLKRNPLGGIRMPILEWSDTQPRVELSTGEEFEDAVNRLAARCSADRPTIVALYAHGHQVMLGLGLPQSFVQIQRWDNQASGPALVTVGDSKADGGVAFYLFGSQHTEIPRRNLIPGPMALRLARQFFESGQVKQDVDWEPA